MPLLKDDIRLFKSDTMNDTLSGGGDITSIEVVSGASNNIFDDVSPLSRVYGDVSLRKVFASVFTQNVLKYYGSHTILSKMPKDDKLDVALFSTNNWHDRRDSASGRIEAYRDKGADYFGYLFSTQYAGSSVVTIFQNEDSPIPSIGEVLYINQPSTNDHQFIKIRHLEAEVRTFTVQGSTFQKRVLSLTITQPLVANFYGLQMSNDDSISPLAKLSKTIIADSGKYYSTRPTTEAAVVGDTSVKVDSIFSQLVPSSLQETPLIQVQSFTTTESMSGVTPSASPVEFETNVQITSGTQFHLSSSILPNSLELEVSGAVIVDTGGKVLVSGQEIGSINYKLGVISFSGSCPTYNGAKTAKFIPAVVTSPIADSLSFEVTDANRGLIYTRTLPIQPAAKSVKFVYRSFGKTYELIDNGSGVLVGDDPAIGSGSVDYATKQVTVTIGALPDVGSEILIQWGETTEHIIQQPQTSAPPYFKVILNDTGADASSVSLTWNRYAVAKTASISVAGVLSGDATGRLDFSTGELRFTPNDMIPTGTTVNIAMTATDSNTYSQSGVVVQTVNGNDDVLTIDVGDTNLAPNSVSIKYTVDGKAKLSARGRNNFPDISEAIEFKIYDDGVGGLIRKNADGTTTAVLHSTIDYVTGIMSFSGVTDIQSPEKSYRYVQFNVNVNWGYYGYYKVEVVTHEAKPKLSGIDVSVTYAKTTNSSAETDSFIASALTMDLVKNDAYYSLPSSLRFQWIGRDYVERQGIIYRNIDPLSGVGIEAGTYNFSNGEVSITSWHDGSTDAPFIQSLIYTTTKVGKSIVAFIINGAPIRVSSFQLLANTIDGTALSASADANGIIDAYLVKGSINIATGSVVVAFGEVVVAAGNETEEWYSAAEVDGSGNIWKPIEVDESSLKYNAIAQSYIPLDKSILGLDPVRLPEDGRVPVYDIGDIAVIRNIVEVVGTYAASTTLDLARTNLSAATAVDNGGVILTETNFTTDLDTGIISWLNLTGVSQPITISHEVEDLVLINDVQITGKISFNSQLAHDYPQAGTLVSSALIHGDVFASVSEPFDQQVWTNVWADIVIGSTTTAELNSSLYPIVVTNASTIEEDWLLQFTNSTTVNVIGKTVGQIGTGVSINSNIAILNPSTGFPYFEIDFHAFGGGWSSGNVIRFKTTAANKPIWIIQSVQQGVASNTDEDALTFCTSVRGSRNA